ncbi:hypothetical protein PTTG_06679 [Puccinia triticina 1-1 BBBD Race 1]|uniref:Major facilitator superfamily (MFS) profile domain-containing protein n=1 Tax=Puccinia triticina (isolate 1-1 / race 1 (BBBD)) TaxID=630390 RepID=A0A0C4F0R2_PUCT1|nr:hypothetical protein PTTG_06679 [Puccinia triticina 1-1 BBBD Race 1]
MSHQGSKLPIFNKSKSSDNLETVDTSWHDPPVDKGRCALQYLVAMFTIETFLWGFATSFGVLLNFYQDDPRSPIKSDPDAKAILTLVGTVNTGIMSTTAPLVSFWIAKKPGIRRPMMYSGLLVCTLSLFLSAYATSAFHILLSQGIGYGFGGCALYFSALSHLPEWFEVRRGLANGVVVTGTGLGGFVFPLLLDSLLAKYNAKFALQVIVKLETHTLPTSVLRRRCQAKFGELVPRIFSLFNVDFLDLYIFKHGPINRISPAGLVPSDHCLGLGSITGSYLLSILHAGTIFAQLAAGALSDHYSPFLIGLTANVLGGASVFVLWGALSQNGIVWLFVFAAIYGCTAADPELLFCGYGILFMTRGVGNILGGPISSAIISSTQTSSHQCSGLPIKGPFSGLICFVAIFFLSGGLLGSLLWLYFRLRPASKFVNQDASRTELDKRVTMLQISEEKGSTWTIS